VNFAAWEADDRAARYCLYDSRSGDVEVEVSGSDAMGRLISTWLSAHIPHLGQRDLRVPDSSLRLVQ
jgi:hypothetical protein